jgi:hypothetical protein
MVRHDDGCRAHATIECRDGLLEWTDQVVIRSAEP